MEQLITRSSEKWSKVSPSAHALKQNMVFESNNEYGFPDFIPTPPFNPPSDLIAFTDKKIRNGGKDYNKFLHFYTDDYRFETAWSRPFNLLSVAERFGGIITPDFSVLAGMPKAMNIWNVYRNRWLARYLVESGVNKVVPSVVWGDESTYAYAFVGIPKNCVVAVSTVGTHNLENRKLFVKGFEVMINYLSPQMIYVYGEKHPVEFNSFGIPIFYYHSETYKLRERIKSKI